MTPEPPERSGADEPPPFLGTWTRVYSMVVWYLAGLIAVLYGLSRMFSAS